MCGGVVCVVWCGVGCGGGVWCGGVGVGWMNRQIENVIDR